MELQLSDCACNAMRLEAGAPNAHIKHFRVDGCASKAFYIAPTNKDTMTLQDLTVDNRRDGLATSGGTIELDGVNMGDSPYFYFGMANARLATNTAQPTADGQVLLTTCQGAPQRVLYRLEFDNVTRFWANASVPAEQHSLTVVCRFRREDSIAPLENRFWRTDPAAELGRIYGDRASLVEALFAPVSRSNKVALTVAEATTPEPRADAEGTWRTSQRLSGDRVPSRERAGGSVCHHPAQTSRGSRSLDRGARSRAPPLNERGRCAGAPRPLERTPASASHQP